MDKRQILENLYKHGMIDGLAGLAGIEEQPKEFIDEALSKLNLLYKIDEGKISRLYKAALAYQNLNVCYRLGKKPTEKLFTELDKAKKIMEEMLPKPSPTRR